LQLAGNKEEELYRELLLGQCHRLFNIMPFMFEAIDDATELLLPDNLTKTDSILKGLVNEIPEEDWSEIEVIGWLYQFYISEHKDAVIGKVVKSEDIPAATQLFTPNWIVKYLVQNSLGRQWLATYPESDLKGKMEYYIEPAEQSDDVIEQLKAITPTSIDPEEIKVLDPAAGSGHILVEVYEVLREIYLERGYRLREIPELILTKNIYGLDIDDRAAQLAGFALMMKAREDDRRIFQRVEDGEVALNVYSLQSSEHLDIPKLWKALDLEGNQQAGSTGGLFDSSDEFINPIGVYKEYFGLLHKLKTSFVQAKNLGSLIQIEHQDLYNLRGLKEDLEKKSQGSDPVAKQTALELLPIINQAICLAQRYDSVIANPPYMGKKAMNGGLKKLGSDHYPDSKLDIFTMFMERCGLLINEVGYNAQVNMQAWMFLSSYENLRENLFGKFTFENIAHLGTRAFSEISGEIVKTVAWICTHKVNNFKGTYIDCSILSEKEKVLSLSNDNGNRYHTNIEDFKEIPGWPLAYWVDNSFIKLFKDYPKMEDQSSAMQGLVTADNERFVRFWHETDFSSLYLNCPTREICVESNKKWFPYNKGGSYRKWYGNHEHIVNWKNDGEDIKHKKANDLKLGKITANNSKCWNQSFYFKEAVSWSGISTGRNSFRLYPEGSIFSGAGLSAFYNESNKLTAIGLLNSNLYRKIIGIISPGHNLTSGEFSKFPFIDRELGIDDTVAELIAIHTDDWNSLESSFDFRANPLLSSQRTLKENIKQYLLSSNKISAHVYDLERGLNTSINENLGLNDGVTSNVKLSEITLFSNVNYRYDESFSETIKSNRYVNDLNTELLSYSLGCMMGRYSLDREGLVYAQSGNEGFKELVAEGAYKTFPADDDGIVPLASEDWLFGDDATARFREFVKTVWGGDLLQENLEFVAESLCLHALKPVKGENANDTVRRYFSKQFYKDHCKTYKKRPIYWLFSSGKEKAFECLVYLHRYNEGTLSRMRTEYVTPLMGKYEHMLNHLADKLVDATSSEKRDIEKEQKSLTKKQAELRTFDEQLKHYAEMRITLDLDDGVKANYGKFGNLLADVKAIHGKAVK
jgi:type II restriction/modification system DNA methylase subunit YeeA